MPKSGLGVSFGANGETRTRGLTLNCLCVMTSEDGFELNESTKNENRERVEKEETPLASRWAGSRCSACRGHTNVTLIQASCRQCSHR